MTRRPVTPQQLRQVEEAFDTLHPSRALAQRLEASLAEHGQPRRSGPWLRAAIVAGALVLGLALGWRLGPTSSAPTVSQGEPEIEVPSDVASTLASMGLEVLASGCALEPADDEALRVSAGCQLRLSALGVKVDAWAPTTLRRTPAGLAMGEGLAAFAVEPVPAGRRPVEIDVGPAVVRVVGTRFVITNGASLGHLDLVEGRVELVHGSDVVSVTPGRRASWTREGLVEPDPSHAGADVSPTAPAALAPDHPASPAPDHPAAPALDHPAAPSQTPAVGRATEPDEPDASARLAEVLAEVARLRRQRAYDRALARLESLATDAWDRSTRAVLSYERGTLLEAAGRTQEACAHWARHRARFAGQGPTDVEARRARLACDR